MQLADRIEAIEARLAVINLALWQLCKNAGVDYGTVHSWRTGKRSPRISNAEKHLAKLEAELTKAERSILSKLQKHKRRHASRLPSRAQARV